MTGGKRAQQVCFACKARKKACDKTLPACNFCTERKLVCRYHTSPSIARYTENGAGKNFVILSSPLSTESQAVDQLEPLTIPKVQSSPFSHLSATKTPLSLNVSIYQHVSDVIELAKLTLDDISGRYFQTFHLFLPIIAPSLFYQRASSYREGIPSADFSVLILMCLLTISEPGSMDSASSQELLYATSKSLLLQTQTAICASIPLIQAAFIITVYEYACARPKIAYISLSTCISMARILGLIGSTSLQDEVQDHVNPKIEYLEKSNLSWAIVMLERIILCEIHQTDMRPVTEWPKPEALLPSDLCPIEQLEAGHFDVKALKARLSTVQATDISRFGRQAQAVSLLDQYLGITRAPAHKQSTVVVSELQQLDCKIQAFLSDTINDDYAKRSLRCAACAICVRLLFLTHGTVLSLLQVCSTGADDLIGGTSRAALGMACRMMVDVSRFQLAEDAKNGVATMSLCCCYNFEAAIEFLHEYDKEVGGEDVKQDINYLLASKRRLHRRWMFPEIST